MPSVWEVKANEEYAWQVSEGLYASLEAAKKYFPDYSASIDSGVNFEILAKPEFAEEVKKEYERREGRYWWYHLSTDDACIGIFLREVKE